MKLIAISDGQHSVNELASMIIQIKDFVDYVHIREKTKTPLELVTLLDLLKKGNVNHEKIVMNDRLDLALLYGIQNVHLPGYGLPIWDVKEKYPHLKIGRSVHSLEEAKQAERDGADYVLYGHCFETNCKPGKPPNGIELLSQIVRLLQIPVYAIGGITPERVSLVNHAGADAIAVMSGIFSVKDPVAAARNFFEKVRGSYNETKF